MIRVKEKIFLCQLAVKYTPLFPAFVPLAKLCLTHGIDDVFGDLVVSWFSTELKFGNTIVSTLMPLCRILLCVVFFWLVKYFIYFSFFNSLLLGISEPEGFFSYYIPSTYFRMQVLFYLYPSRPWTTCSLIWPINWDISTLHFKMLFWM